MTEYVATRWYRSPQLLVGQPYAKPADMFAVGCILGQLVDGQPMFPGQNQIDQIFLLKKYIGQLTTNQHRCLFDNRKLSGAQIPPNKKKETLWQRYLGKIQRNALLFMKACLKMDPVERLTVEQALKHPYLIQLSTKDKQFDNDEQNLLNENRKTVLKNQKGLGSLTKIQDEFKSDESRHLFKNKSLTKKEAVLMANYGSVDYGNLATHLQREKNYSNISNHETLYKKQSHQDLIGMKSKQQAKTRSNFNKGLVKNMSEQKHLKVNLDVNVQINLKIKKDNDKNKFYNLIDSNQGKLPELKNISKGAKNKQSLFGITKSKRWGEKSNLSIFGQSKQLSNQYLSKKLGNIAN